MASLNSVTLIGRVVGPPELRYTPGGKAVASFTIAVDRRRGGSAQDKQQQETDFIPIVAWERLAEICNEYLNKGKLICISGRLQTRTYEQEGQKRKAFEIVASDMQMLSSGAGAGGGSGEQRSYGDRPQQSRQPAAVGGGGGGTGGGGGWASDVGFSDDGVGMDDVPF